MSAINKLILSILAGGVLTAVSTLSAEQPFFKAPGFPSPPLPPAVAEEAPPSGNIRAESNLYSIGDPTPEEQLYLELVNRARANPPQEGILLSQSTEPDILNAYSYFQVDKNLMQNQFSLIAPAQPLAMNEKLTVAARKHSEDMFANVYQGHNGTDGSTPATRISAEGYLYLNAAENVYSTASSVTYGHAGFEVDWGPGPGGMQTPPGHRENIHAPIYREAGVGVVLGSNSNGSSEVGPQLVTEEFGLHQNSTPFITGVAYYDLNGNHFYDVGEGIGGLNVAIDGQSTGAITAKSGGYAIPVPTSGSYVLVFSGTGLTSQTNQVLIQNLQNSKVDFTPTYLPPTITGPAKPVTNVANTYQITPVGGARLYQWRQFQTQAGVAEGAENGTNKVTITTTTNYTVVVSDVFKSGTHSFHLAHPAPGQQIIALNPVYIPLTNNSSISFQSRLGYASTAQIAYVQVSSDNGLTWSNIFSQAGTGGSGETVFTLKTLSLAGFKGQTLKIRFVYDFESGSYYNQTSADAGWHIDDIQFSTTSEITNEQTHETSIPTFDLNPSIIASYAFQARALTGHDYLPWGPITYVNSSSPPPQFKITGFTRQQDGSFNLNFDLVSGTAPANITIQATRTLNDAWGAPIAISVQNVSPGKYVANTFGLARSSTAFFRVLAN